MSVDIEALIATVREALRTSDYEPYSEVLAALDSLAAELEAQRIATDTMARRSADLERAVERVKAERDENMRSALYWAEKEKSAQASLDKALSALREIADPENDSSEARRTARRCIAEIEGEAS
jgi:hypothetical protein